VTKRERYNAYMREYMNKRYHARRAWALAYLGGKCVCCEMVDDLEVDHIDPSTKSCGPFNDASLAWDRFVAELDKCQLLCRACHLEKSRAEGSFAKNRRRGEQLSHAKLTESGVKVIRQLLSEGHTQQAIADRFGVSRECIKEVKAYRTWAHVPG